MDHERGFRALTRLTELIIRVIIFTCIYWAVPLDFALIIVFTGVEQRSDDLRTPLVCRDFRVSVRVMLAS